MADNTIEKKANIAEIQIAFCANEMDLLAVSLASSATLRAARGLRSAGHAEVQLVAAPIAVTRAALDDWRQARRRSEDNDEQQRSCHHERESPTGSRRGGCRRVTASCGA